MLIKKAIFPVAGLGTRFLPATKAIPKEMIPIVDVPMIQYIVEEAVRAGIEGTISQAVRGFGLRRSRYVGQAKTHLQHVATAAAMNLVRMTEWLGGAEMATTRRSKFRALMAQAA